MTQETSGFTEHRARLFGLAYRMLGSAAEAEDVLQEAHVRWESAERSEIESPGAWLTTVVTRLCLDQLKSARARRETYVGPWLPEPVPTADAPLEPLDLESISFAFLLLLENLSPLERAVFVLKEVFDYSYAEIAGMLGREESACRQLGHRAKEHLRARRPRFAPSREQHEKLLGAFLGAVGQGDLAGLQRLLADDVVARSDGGGRVRAALNPLFGVDHVSRFFMGLARKGLPGFTFGIEEINGWPAVVTYHEGAVFNAMLIETDDEKIHAIHVVANPDKLALLRS